MSDQIDEVQWDVKLQLGTLCVVVCVGRSDARLYPVGNELKLLT